MPKLVGLCARFVEGTNARLLADSCMCSVATAESLFLICIKKSRSDDVMMSVILR